MESGHMNDPLNHIKAGCVCKNAQGSAKSWTSFDFTAVISSSRTNAPNQNKAQAQVRVRENMLNTNDLIMSFMFATKKEGG